MNLAGRLARLEKASASRAGAGACALCGESGEAVISAPFADAENSPPPRAGCPRCGHGGVYVVAFETPSARTELET